MTQTDIEVQLKADYDKFSNQYYPGYTPDNIMAMFEKALIDVPPGVHNIGIGYLEKLIKKSKKELTTIDVGLVVNTIKAARWSVVFDGNISEAIKEMKNLDRVLVEYNKMANAFENEIQIRRQRLEQLASGPILKPVYGKA